MAWWWGSELKEKNGLSERVSEIDRQTGSGSPALRGGLRRRRRRRRLPFVSKQLYDMRAQHGTMMPERHWIHYKTNSRTIAAVRKFTDAECIINKCTLMWFTHHRFLRAELRQMRIWRWMRTNLQNWIYLWGSWCLRCGGVCADGRARARGSVCIVCTTQGNLHIQCIDERVLLCYLRATRITDDVTLCNAEGTIWHDITIVVHSRRGFRKSPELERGVGSTIPLYRCKHENSKNPGDHVAMNTDFQKKKSTETMEKLSPPSLYNLLCTFYPIRTITFANSH